MDWQNRAAAEIVESPDEYQFFLKAPDVDVAAIALCEFLIATHSGEKNLRLARRNELRVKIQPGSSVEGLFWHGNVTFHM